ncbi:Phosphodiest-domain-containing protein [Infundibulicybe gibba]|nr:Phosphodiest-domain-containing protein [Infundibulicybe gibba]
MPPIPPKSPYSTSSSEEERKGLLASADDSEPTQNYEDPSPHSWSRRKLTCTAGAIIFLIVSGVCARILLLGAPGHRGVTAFSGHNLRSNGTHNFKRTALIVSIDGLRADYLDRGLTPHLLEISKQGLRAKSMIPVFPVRLHAESHGIVANNFWDPVTQTEFHYSNITSCWTPSWWLGEPIWETASKAGMVTANLMWPGPPRTSTGAASTYFVPWKNKVPLGEKLEQIINCLDIPLAFMKFMCPPAYEPSLDQAGHSTGPMSALVNRTLGEVDAFAKDLHTELKARNLTDIVDIVFVSDHGMTDTSHLDAVYMDDILGEDGIKMVEHEDGWPSMGLRFHPTANASHYLDLLQTAAAKNPEKFSVYTHETMLERYHFSHHERIAPIYVVPNIGYILTTRAEGDTGMSKGNHGYDNQEVSMQAMFVAHGPFSAVVKLLHQSRASSLSARFLKGSNQGWHSTANDVYVMDKFPNVNVYNLIIKLLGIESYAAPNNGTAGFWDKYF